MNKVLSGVILLVTGVYVLGQEIPSFEKKIYAAPDGKLYIQKDLPAYLWLSVQPGENSPKYRLWSEETKAYSNPMYFDVEGWNSVRSPSAVDTSSRKVVIPLRDIVFEIYADGTAPETRISYGDSKPSFADNMVQVGKGTVIKFSSTDILSGVENIYYSVDGSPFKPFTADLAIEKEKEYELKYFAVDNVGNAEKLHQVRIIFDVTSPVSKLDIEGDRFENTLSGRSKIILSADDKGTGVKDIFYTINESTEKKYTGPILAANYAQNDHKISFYAVDKVGNRENMQTFSFYIDKTPPTIIEEILGKSFFSGGQEFSSGKSRLKLTSFDNKAGVKEIRYSLNDGEYKVYDSPVFLNQASGNMRIKSYAIDNVNNRSVSQTANEKTNIPYIDLTGPVISHSFKGPMFESRDTVFVSASTSIVLKGTDSEAGLSQIEYRVNSGDPAVYKSPFNLIKEEYCTIEYTGYDNVDNTSSKSFGVKVDNTGPEVSVVFGTLPVGRKDGMEIYPVHAVLFLAATDRIVGYQRMSYSVNGGPSQEYGGAIRNLPKGKIDLKISAFDKLTNATNKTVNFFIE